MEGGGVLRVSLCHVYFPYIPLFVDGQFATVCPRCGLLGPKCSKWDISLSSPSTPASPFPSFAPSLFLSLRCGFYLMESIWALMPYIPPPLPLKYPPLEIPPPRGGTVTFAEKA